ncbi:MAG: hypothetical protein JW860_11345 [Sedimentisphaerales bacterium]|nr:hypothetical protein [Sedimentisphaerales bacterium]
MFDKIYFNICFVTFLLVILSGSVIVSEAQDTTDTGDHKAVILDVDGSLNREDLDELNSAIDLAVSEGIKTLIFNFEGRGRSFDNFSELGDRILYLTDNKGIRAIAYIPHEAQGMTMLAVMACREIITRRSAILGKVISRDLPPDEEPREYIDEQKVLTRIASFAKAGGHDPMLARAMTDRKMILYQIGREEDRKFVDKEEFEIFVHNSQPPWQMIGPGPIVASGEVMLLSGDEALEYGLVSSLAYNEEDLAGLLGIEIIAAGDIKGTTEVEVAEAADVKMEPNVIEDIILTGQDAKAAFIVCSEMVDEGLYESIKRRTEYAIENGATYIIYEMDTFGGRVDSALEIWKYFMHDVAPRAHTVAYVRTKAISAGALISVACQDIIMRANTQLGDCAPIMMGGTLEGVEREKMESPLRSYFEDAAQTNGYPVALCKAMVTITHEVYRVKNNRTGEYEYFEKNDLPRKSREYDLADKKLIVGDNELLTLNADKAKEYGLAREVVTGIDDQARDNVLAFLEKRDNITFARPVSYLTTNWSEELVRWLTSPAVSAILLMIALLGIYAELNSPGLGLPGAVAVAALLILFGSKFLIGMANWWEIAVFFIGLGLLLVEIFVIPGFGLAGITGILLVLFALGAMMVNNRPGEFPLPTTDWEWAEFEKQVYGLLAGFIGACLGGYFLGKYIHKLPVTNKLALAGLQDSVEVRAGGQAAPSEAPPVTIGQEGIAISPLRPAGIGRFDGKRVEVISRGELIQAKQKIQVVAIEGNSVIVKEIKEEQV